MTRYLIIPLLGITTLAGCAGSNANVKPSSPVDVAYPLREPRPQHRRS